MIDSAAIAEALQLIARQTAAASDELCRADGAVGDGDLGLTVANGFTEANLLTLPDDVGIALLEIAKAFQRVSSSSYGTLLATGLITVAKQLKGRTQISPEEISSLISAACEGMMARGKAKLGDKTVVDSLEAVAAAVNGKGPDQMLDAAIQAADQTIEKYRNRPSKLGRARMFGEKSIGLVDPGQLALLRILEGLTRQTSAQ